MTAAMGHVSLQFLGATGTVTSAHADADGLLAWLKTAPAPPRTCYVVHGEPPASAALADRIDRELGWCAVQPRDAERVLV